jgi:hypothetical protein
VVDQRRPLPLEQVVKEGIVWRYSAAIGKMSMDGWRSRSEMRAAGHSSAVNVTLGEETIHGSASGESTNIEAPRRGRLNGVA